MRQPVSARLKSILGSIIVLIVAGILLPLLIIEVAAHVMPDLIPAEVKTSIFQVDPPYKVLSPDNELGYKFAPNVVNYPVSLEKQQYTISTVSLGYADIGFRDDGIAAGQPFAVVVGDSFANCAGVEVEDCWVELLEEEFNWDFANLSVLGYSPQQEATMLAKYGLPLKPKWVLWVFFANDMKDAWRVNQFGSGAARNTEFWQSPVRTWLVENSAIYVLVSFMWYNRYFFYNLVAADETTSGNPNLSWWLSNTDLTIPEIADGFDQTQTIILNAHQQTLAQDDKLQFVVIILPFREQVYADPQLQTRFDHLNDSLIKFLQENDIPVIDLTADLRERAKAEPVSLYFEEDIHLNPRGNEIVAELLKQRLTEVFE